MSGAVSNNTQSDLTITAAGGNVTLSGNLAVGTNDRPTPIGDVSITASSGTVTMGSSGTPTYADAKSLSVTANAANVYAKSSDNFTCGTGSSSTGVCLTDSASFNVASASTFSGPLSGTTTLTKSGAGALDMSGVSTFSGNTTVSAGKLEISGTGKLGNGNYAGNISVTGQIRFNNSVDQTLSGTISGSGFINSPGSGTLTISTLGGASSYNLGTAYVIPTGSSGGSSSSSIYGNAPTFSYQLATTAGGGTVITDAEPSGTVVLDGTPGATSNVGNYTVGYDTGLTLGSERYTSLQAGNDLSWTVNARPLTVTVSKTYDGSASFSSGFSLSGTVNGDATPTPSGGASVSSANVGSYNSFAGSTLASSDSNYTFTGATISAAITQRALNLSVSKMYDGSAVFSREFQVTGMAGGDSAPTVTGTAAVANANAGDYTSFLSNALALSNTNYSLDGGTVLARILPESPTVPVTTSPTITLPEPNSSTPPLALPETTDAPLATNNLMGAVTDYSPTGQSNTATSPNSQPSSTGTAPGQESNRTSPTNATSGAPKDSSVVPSSQQREIVISLVQEPSAEAGGMVNVLVPKDMIVNTGGFSFPLPEKIMATDATALVVTKVGGEPLPNWLHFNPETIIFTASSVPAGGLPLHVVIAMGDSQTTIVISEMP